MTENMSLLAQNFLLTKCMGDFGHGKSHSDWQSLRNEGD